MGSEPGDTVLESNGKEQTMKRFKNIAVLLGETSEDKRILMRAGKLARMNEASQATPTISPFW